MTTPNVPLCSDFILQTIRATRRPPDKTQSAPSGIRIDRVYEIVSASRLYSDEQYRIAVNELHKTGTIALRSAQDWTGRRASSIDIVLTNDIIPNWFNFQTSSLYTDFDGNKLPDSFYQQKDEDFARWRRRVHQIEHIRYGKILFYIVEDGLPAIMKNLISKDKPANTTPQSKAAAILASMTTNK